MTHDISPTPEELAAVGSCCAAFNVRKASRVITRLYAEAFAPVGLEPTQFMLLVACARQATVTMGALAGRMSMDPSALARNVTILERRGLVRIVPGADRRVRDISISAKGRKTLSRALPRWRDVQAKLAGQVGEDSFRSAVELMKGIVRSSEALLDHPISQEPTMPVRWIDPSPVLRVERFNSFDEFRPNDVIGGMRSTPLDSSPISASRSILALPDCLLVLQRSFARRMEGDLGANRGVGLVIPLAFHATMNGNAVGDSTIGVIRGRVPVDVVERHANTYLMLRFGSDMSNRGWAEFDGGIELFRLAPAKMLALRSAILDMFCLASGCRDLREFELLSGQLQETLIAGLDNALVQDSVKRVLPGSFDRHRKLVERLDELVAAVGEADLYSTGLAQTLGVSVRTLQTAVQHICGVSLHQHLRSKRMWSVRKLLVKGSPLLTVTAAARANGFWHLSDFARCYSRAYGEMPSETLTRARGA